VPAVSDHQYRWRGDFDNGELEALHAEAFGHEPDGYDWEAQVSRHSLGWVTARRGPDLVGFVNVAWDGGSHAFLIDTAVSTELRRQGVGTRLAELAVENSQLAGCEWVHVDFDDELGDFYIGACGFDPTPAGLIRLS